MCTRKEVWKFLDDLVNENSSWLSYRGGKATTDNRRYLNASFNDKANVIELNYDSLTIYMVVPTKGNWAFSTQTGDLVKRPTKTSWEEESVDDFKEMCTIECNKCSLSFLKKVVDAFLEEQQKIIQTLNLKDFEEAMK